MKSNIKQYVIALREANECLVGYWNGSQRKFVTHDYQLYTLSGARQVCTKNVYEELSDSPIEKYRSVCIESIIV